MSFFSFVLDLWNRFELIPVVFRVHHFFDNDENGRSKTYCNNMFLSICADVSFSVRILMNGFVIYIWLIFLNYYYNYRRQVSFLFGGPGEFVNHLYAAIVRFLSIFPLVFLRGE